MTNNVIHEMIQLGWLVFSPCIWVNNYSCNVSIWIRDL